jgi:DNA adenine methylase Dam
MDLTYIWNRRYLGSKARLVDFIKDTIETNCGQIQSIADIFAGIGTVGWAYNNSETKVIINDILESNFLSYNAWFSNEDFDEEKICELISEFNNFENIEDNYFSDNFSGTYFSRENCRKIGHIRERIEDLWKSNQISFREKAILITSLLYAMDKIANTVGHYDAFRLKGDLSRTLLMQQLAIPKNSENALNQIFKEDANLLVTHIEADLVYIDPPYNSRQYSDAYHLLENVAEWKKEPVFGVAKKMRRTANIKSKYCTLSATAQMEDLIKKIKAKYIVVSYNNTGATGANRSQAKILDDDILHMLSQRGKVEIFEKEINQFTTGKSHFENHKERLFVCYIDNLPSFRKIPFTLDGNNKIISVKSPLNFTGGKTKILSQITRFFKPTGTFIDLFGGGFNVGANVNSDKIVYNDKQKELTRLIRLFYTEDYLTIISKIEDIIEIYGLSKSSKNGYSYYGCLSDSGLGFYNKEKFLNLRDDYNKRKSDTIKSDFQLLTLIIFSFNNQIRFNSRGEFNMPVGKRDLNNSIRKNIRNFSLKLKEKNVEFLNFDYKKIDLSNYSDLFIYCDPPYSLGTATYNEKLGWSSTNDQELLSFLSKVDQAGIPFALSNVIEHKGKKNQALIDWAVNNHFSINYIRSDYSNSSYHLKAKNTNTIEVLITNY